MAGTKAVVACPSLYSKILESTFPQHFSFCFAYGSGVFRQHGSAITKNVVDMILTVEDPPTWHKENISRNPNQYSGLLLLGYNTVARIQENWRATVYFNDLVPIKHAGVTIKYGVVSRSALVTDLLDWNKLCLAGRLHKPVEVIRKTSFALRSS
jgi:translocator assembly and maintenance protein 41